MGHPVEENPLNIGILSKVKLSLADCSPGEPTSVSLDNSKLLQADELHLNN